MLLIPTHYYSPHHFHVFQNQTNWFKAYSGGFPVNFRVVLSIRMWTPVSIGCTINGITPNPMKVVAHFLLTSATWGITLAIVNKDPAHIRLMVNPGMITLANACHNKVSNAAAPILAVRPSSSSGKDLAVFPALSLVSANT